MNWFLNSVWIKITFASRPIGTGILWYINSKQIVDRTDFSDQFRKKISDQFRKIIVRYKRIGYNINIMRQSACLVFNPITVNNFASLFNCTPVGQTQ